jgi:hypothetical protein
VLLALSIPAEKVSEVLLALLTSTADAEENKAIDRSRNCKVFIQDLIVV